MSKMTTVKGNVSHRPGGSKSNSEIQFQRESLLKRKSTEEELCRACKKDVKYLQNVFDTDCTLQELFLYAKD